MQQHADGWKEPEPGFFGADTGSGLELNAKTNWQRRGSGFGTEIPLQLPWLSEAREFLPGKDELDTESSQRGERAVGEDLASLLHDTRNMVAAMGLYCDLLEEPGVLTKPFRHYAGELRLVASASRRLLEKLGALEDISGSKGQVSPCAPSYRSVSSELFRRKENLDSRQRSFPASRPVGNLAEALIANRNLLSALAGPAVTLGMNLAGGNRAISMTGDDLTRVLVNLTRNAAEVMTEGGHIQISLRELPERLLLTCDDTGPGIPDSALKTIFAPGYSTHVNLDTRREPGGDFHSGPGPGTHRGLGLSIVRSLVEAAGGTVRAESLFDVEASGACRYENALRGASFVLEFPIEPPLTP